MESLNTLRYIIIQCNDPFIVIGIFCKVGRYESAMVFVFLFHGNFAVFAFPWVGVSPMCFVTSRPGQSIRASQYRTSFVNAPYEMCVCSCAHEHPHTQTENFLLTRLKNFSPFRDSVWLSSFVHQSKVVCFLFQNILVTFRSSSSSKSRPHPTQLRTNAVPSPPTPLPLSTPPPTTAPPSSSPSTTRTPTSSRLSAAPLISPEPARASPTHPPWPARSSPTARTRWPTPTTRSTIITTTTPQRTVAASTVAVITADVAGMILRQRSYTRVSWSSKRRRKWSSVKARFLDIFRPTPSPTPAARPWMSPRTRRPQTCWTTNTWARIKVSATDSW